MTATSSTSARPRPTSPEVVTAARAVSPPSAPATTRLGVSGDAVLRRADQPGSGPDASGHDADQPQVDAVGLVESYNDHHFLPTMRKVRCRGSVDRVTVKMLPGQILDDYADQGERLAMTFGAQDCRVVTGKRHGDLDLSFLTDDPLQSPVPPIPPADEPDLSALPVALREDGTVYRHPVLHNHTLIAAATGAGKSGAEWAIIHALSFGI